MAVSFWFHVAPLLLFLFSFFITGSQCSPTVPPSSATSDPSNRDGCDNQTTVDYLRTKGLYEKHCGLCVYSNWTDWMPQHFTQDPSCPSNGRAIFYHRARIPTNDSRVANCEQEMEEKTKCLPSVAEQIVLLKRAFGGNFGGEALPPSDYVRKRPAPRPRIAIRHYTRNGGLFGWSGLQQRWRQPVAPFIPLSVQASLPRRGTTPTQMSQTTKATTNGTPPSTTSSTTISSNSGTPGEVQRRRKRSIWPGLFLPFPTDSIRGPPTRHRPTPAPLAGIATPEGGLEGNPRDIALVLDASGSVGRHHFEKAVANIATLLGMLCYHWAAPGQPSDVRFALVVYSTIPKTVFNFRHSAEIHTNSSAIRDSILEAQNMYYDMGRLTGTAPALRLCYNSIFKQDAGMRATSKKKLILITDGYSNRGGSPVPVARRLHEDRDVDVFPIGIGDGVNLRELNDLKIFASKDGLLSQLLILPDFTSLDTVVGEVTSNVDTKGHCQANLVRK